MFGRKGSPCRLGSKIKQDYILGMFQVICECGWKSTKLRYPFEATTALAKHQGRK